MCNETSKPKYNALKEGSTGKYHIKICVGLHCNRKGYTEIFDEFERLLNIKSGEITKDGKFSVDTSGCRGGCRRAPVVSINEDRYTGIKKEDIKDILNNYK